MAFSHNCLHVAKIDIFKNLKELYHKVVAQIGLVTLKVLYNLVYPSSINLHQIIFTFNINI